MIIHNIPTLFNISFNTNLVIISSNVEVPKNKPVYFFKLIHLISMTYKCSLLPIKRNLNMANIFNNDKIIPLFVFIRFSVCSVMLRTENQFIVSFIDIN